MNADSLVFPGEGPDGVVLVHGLGGAPSEMRYLAKHLQKKGYTVSVPQLAGHGGTEDELLRSTWRDWLHSVEAAESALRTRVRRVFAGGVCIGGALAVMLAANRPDIRGTAAYSVTFRYDGWSIPRWARLAPLLQHVAWMPGVRRLAFHESEPYGLKDERLRRLVAADPQRFIAGSLMRLPFGALRQMFRLGTQVERLGSSVRSPTLILHASQDDMSHPRNAWRLQRAIGGLAQVRLLDDCYHMIHVDRQRDLVAQMTADFFGAQAADAA